MDPILNNNYLTQTMEKIARSGVRRVQAEMSFIFYFSQRRTNGKDLRCLLSPRSTYRLHKPIE